MGRYITPKDVDDLYGCTNVQRWADLDNTKQQNAIRDRIELAIVNAEDYIDSRLLNGKYAIPFAAVPRQVKFLTALYTGVLLYDGRQVLDAGEGRDQVSRQRKMFDTYIRRILAGQIKLIHPTTGLELAQQSITHPITVTDQLSCGCYKHCICNCNILTHDLIPECFDRE